MSAAGLISEQTIVVTTVHECQVVETGRVPTRDHDIRVDLIVTPERVIECPRRRARRIPKVAWSELTDEKIATIPLLQRLRQQ